MKVLKCFFTFSLILFISISINAQNDQNKDPKASLNGGTIKSQFDFLYKKSGSYQEYKVVKKTFFQKIKGNVLDSLKSLRNELSDSKKIVSTQSNEISDLKTDLKTTNDNLTSVTNEKDNIKFLGIPMTKASYNSLLWSIIIVLIVFLSLFIYKFKNSNTVTKQANQLLSETEEDFINFKTIALEREQKVRRELQDEINKQKNSSKGKKEI